MTAKRFADASAKFRDAVARVPDPAYFFHLCQSLYQEGKLADGLTACNAATSGSPSPTVQKQINEQIQKIQDEARAQGVDVR